MRILYINHYAGSPRHGMEFRPYYLAREWWPAVYARLMSAASSGEAGRFVLATAGGVQGK
ncbi:hypothetical protein [Vogesella indigofera]|uniref:hypothetical protein n=1 Tax=Vogesella indigofera TaxID=45465 RepID=UPI0035AF45CB